MKKYTLLRFGRCYINPEGDFVIGLLCGDKRHGYQLAASHANSNVWLGQIQLRTRVIPNDGRWTEISHSEFNVASAWHNSGHVVKFPAIKDGREQVVVSKKY